MCRIAPLYLLIASAALCSAATVEIDYTLVAGSASIDPFSIPDPNGGEDFVIAPSLTIDSGSFVAGFQSDAAGIVGNGDATVAGFNFNGSLDIEISTQINIGIPIAVTANLTGPVTGSQVTGSSGTLTGLTTYLETDIGNYDTVAGPLDCSDSAFGLVCAAIEAALGIEFPITQIAGDDAPLPFTGGTYTGLNSTRSSAGNEIEFSLPIDDSTSFGVGIEFSWAETERQLIPEPGGACLLLATGAITLLRRRRH